METIIRTTILSKTVSKSYHATIVFFVGNSLARKFLAYPVTGVYNMVNYSFSEGNMGKEFELKYAATPEQQRIFVEEFGSFSEIAMETTYYDTTDGAFAAQKMTLRRRLENGISVCTLKAPAGPNCRREFELEADCIEAALPELCKLADLPTPTAPLVVVCGARFTRLAKTEDLGACTVELAVDHGVLLGGGREIPLCEIEVELKSGSEEAATTFARYLAQRHGLKPEPKSKFRRALDLAQKK
jgi:inorganic triphosphatase YgiF